MVQPAQSTAAHHANDHARSSDFDEDTMHQYLVQNTHEAIQSWVDHRTGSQTTSGRDPDVDAVAIPSFDDRGQDGDLLSRVVDLPLPKVYRSPRVTFHALQEWEGYVTSIKDTEFSARLTDLTSKAKYASEEASIPLEEISDDDAAKMQVGSIFRWVIGYERTAGSKKRVSNIVFRDLPVITKSDLRDGQEWAHSIVVAFQQ